MPKRLIVCSDGTWNKPNQEDRGKVRPTNVAKTALAILPHDRNQVEQRIFYDTGVGARWYRRIRGGAFGYGLSDNVKDAYRFLVNNYEDGDDVYFFGFSRGAYTVRSTAGLIRNSGLLRNEYVNRIDEAYRLYRRRDEASHPQDHEARLFRKNYSREIRIKFIGVWDTVGALGIPIGWLNAVFNRRWQFHDVKLSSMVKNAFQALAIDEKRKPFQPAIWEQQRHAHDEGQTLEQAWFAGVHSNIGGGYANSGLSDVAFLWMKQKAETCDLVFDTRYINQMIKPNAAGELRKSRKWFYRLWRPYHRKLGRASWSYEFAHRSAVDRRNTPLSPPYEPDNLDDYLQAEGPVTPPRNRKRYW